MSHNQQPVEPKEAKAWLFHHADRLYNSLIPRSVRGFVKLLLFQVSPDVPASLTSAWRDANFNAVFTIAASLTFIMCFVVVTAWSSVAGTLVGSDPSRLYFLNDWVNLLNYTVLCPLYVGFGAVLIAATVRGWAELNQLTAPTLYESRPLGRYRTVFLLLLIILTASFLGNAKFMTENMDPAIYPLNYWFIDHVRPDGSRVIGAFGFYYGVLNFFLLFFSLLVAATFVAEFRLLFQVAESLDRLTLEQSEPTEELRSRLKTFTQVYLAGKLVIAFYMANALVWKTSQAQQSTNLFVLGGALTFFGVVFLSIPRYYIELQWFRLRTARAGTALAAPEYEDLRPSEIDFVGGSWKPRVVATIIDTAIIGGFVTSFWL